MCALKLDKRRKYYLVLDTETATLPFVSKYDGKARQTIGVTKPLVYDLGWQIVDAQGRVYSRKNFLISEIFSVPSIFDTAYYASKRPLYLSMLEKGEIILTDWKTATAELVEALNAVEGVTAYNAAFDFKRSIPFTELYISYLYSPDFHEWLTYQERVCDRITNGEQSKRAKSQPEDTTIFRFRGSEYPLFDLWSLSCEHILNTDNYRAACHEHGWISPSGKYYKTSAETCYRYIKGDNSFDEAHTALDDATIESEIFAELMRVTKKKFDMGIVAFPFRVVGRADL